MGKPEVISKTGVCVRAVIPDTTKQKIEWSDGGTCAGGKIDSAAKQVLPVQDQYEE